MDSSLIPTGGWRTVAERRDAYCGIVKPGASAVVAVVAFGLNDTLPSVATEDGIKKEWYHRMDSVFITEVNGHITKVIKVGSLEYIEDDRRATIRDAIVFRQQSRIGGLNNVRLLDFTITNPTDYGFKDILIRCAGVGESGTEIDHSERTAYIVVSGHGSRSVKGFNMGFVSPQAVRGGCMVKDLALDPDFDRPAGSGPGAPVPR
jgi:hypothetical protein